MIEGQLQCFKIIRIFFSFLKSSVLIIGTLNQTCQFQFCEFLSFHPIFQKIVQLSLSWICSSKENLINNRKFQFVNFKKQHLYLQSYPVELISEFPNNSINTCTKSSKKKKKGPPLLNLKLQRSRWRCSDFRETKVTDRARELRKNPVPVLTFRAADRKEKVSIGIDTVFFPRDGK